MRFLLTAFALALPLSASAIDVTPRPVAPDGTPATIDLPVTRHVRNAGGSDGSGLCVFTSVQQSADWHNVPQLAGFQRWMTRRPGGGYPEKLDREVTLYCASQGKPAPAYVQHTGGDEAFLDLAVKTGRLVSITYAGADGFYPGPVLHMVNLAHLDAERGAVIDNNRPGQWVWMTRRQLLNRWRGLTDAGSPMLVRDGGQVFAVGGGWAVVLLAPPPPPYARPRSTAPETMPEPIPEVMNFGLLQPPAAPAPAGDNFGVDAPRLRAAQRKFSLNGTEVSRAVAFAAVLADDSDRHHLTFVGLPLPATLPAAVRDRAHVQAYSPGDWPVTQFGLRPGVTLRRPAVNRVSAEVTHADGFDAAAVLAALGAAPAPPEPTPPGSITLTADDLTPEARARLDAAGLGTLSLTLGPKAKPPAARGEVPAYPAPPGDGWRWANGRWERPVPR